MNALFSCMVGFMARMDVYNVNLRLYLYIYLISYLSLSYMYALEVQRL